MKLAADANVLLSALIGGQAAVLSSALSSSFACVRKRLTHIFGLELGTVAKKFVSLRVERDRVDKHGAP